MRSSRLAGLGVLLLVLASSCARDAATRAAPAAAHIEPRSALPQSAVVGSTIDAPIAVAVTDVEGRPVSGVAVLFVITAGNGSVSPSSARTDGDGHAVARLTLGTIAGANEVTASVRGVGTSLRFTTVGVAAATRLVTIAPRPARFPVGTESQRLTTATFDEFGNRTTQAVALIVRDTSLLAIDNAGVARVRRRGGSTYIVALAGNRVDSVLAIVLAPGDSPCTAIATGRSLALGEVVTDAAASGICISASAADEEYVLIPYLASGTPSSSIQLQVLASGVGTIGPAADVGTSSWRGNLSAVPHTDLQADFDRTLRRVEAREMPRFIGAARAWQAARAPSAAPRSSAAISAPSAASIPSNVAVGDLFSLNTNANEYCSNPKLRAARVVAVSQRAIVVADTANPAGGFTDADYRAIAVTFDTLVNPVDVGAFGEPSDIDQNGRVVIFFTRAVNELTPRGSQSFILGFYFSRDLLPRTGSQGGCPASNVAEMFYLLVPDSAGVASDARTKAFVHSVSNGTVAHEFQHLINASRRLYVNHAPEINEETWLNEGLSHAAEELVFYRAAGLEPRQNFTASLLAAEQPAAAFKEFQFNNFRRYAAYLRSTAIQGPVGVAGDDDLETRGAAWSLLRYLADRVAANDATFWYRLVNAQTTGLTNLASVLGRDPMPLMRDWAVSVYLDDVGPAIDPRFTQPSWNVRALLPAIGTAFPLNDSAIDRRLVDGVPSLIPMRGGGAAFLRFLVPAHSEALLTVSTGGQPAPASVQLSVARLR